jgi:hypothetical protein
MANPQTVFGDGRSVRRVGSHLFLLELLTDHERIRNRIKIKIRIKIRKGWFMGS